MGRRRRRESGLESGAGLISIEYSDIEVCI